MITTGSEFSQSESIRGEASLSILPLSCHTSNRRLHLVILARYPESEGHRMLVEQQIAERRERARDAIAKVLERPSGAPYGDYRVKSASGKTYPDRKSVV